MPKEDPLQDKLAKIKRKLTVISIMSILVALGLVKGVIGLYGIKSLVELPRNVRKISEQVNKDFKTRVEEDLEADPEGAKIQKEADKVLAEIQASLKTIEKDAAKTDKTVEAIALSLAVHTAIYDTQNAILHDDYKTAETHLRRAQQNWKVLTEEFGSTKETLQILNVIINLKQDIHNLRVTTPLYVELERVTNTAVPIFAAARNEVREARKENRMPRNLAMHAAKIEVVQEKLKEIKKIIQKQRKTHQDKTLLKEVNDLLDTCAAMLQVLRQF
jgi:hypothetical protein